MGGLSFWWSRGESNNCLHHQKNDRKSLVFVEILKILVENPENNGGIVFNKESLLISLTTEK